jgi:hypothetical protein
MSKSRGKTVTINGKVYNCTCGKQHTNKSGKWLKIGHLRLPGHIGERPQVLRTLAVKTPMMRFETVRIGQIMKGPMGQIMQNAVTMPVPNVEKKPTPVMPTMPATPQQQTQQEQTPTKLAPEAPYQHPVQKVEHLTLESLRNLFVHIFVNISDRVDMTDEDLMLALSSAEDEINHIEVVLNEFIQSNAPSQQLQKQQEQQTEHSGGGLSKLRADEADIQKLLADYPKRLDILENNLSNALSRPAEAALNSRLQTAQKEQASHIAELDKVRKKIQVLEEHMAMSRGVPIPSVTVPGTTVQSHSAVGYAEAVKKIADLAEGLLSQFVTKMQSTHADLDLSEALSLHQYRKNMDETVIRALNSIAEHQEQQQ